MSETIRTSARDLLVGRDPEKAHLELLLAEARVGMGRVVSLQGEPGAGKTRLARWLTPRATELGFRVAWGVCAHADRAPPFSPWTQVLRKLLASHERTLPPHLGRLSAIVPDLGIAPTERPEDAGLARYALFSAMVDALSELTLDGPVVVMLDDVHDADVGSLNLLLHLVPHLYDLPVLVVCTRRTAGARRTAEKDEVIEELSIAWSEVELGPLAPDDVAACIEALTNARPAPSLVRTIAERTGGNAFFVDRVVRGLVTHGRLTDEIPVSVRALISRRLRAIDASGTDILAALAILKRPAAPSRVAAIAGQPLDRVLEVLDAAQRDGLVDTFVDSPGDVAFRHELVRLSVHNSLKPIKRAQLYAQAARALAPDVTEQRHEWTAQLARLWSGAALLGPEPRQEAYTWARRAGDWAMRATSFETAADWYERAVSLGGPADEAPRLLIDLGQAQLAAGRREGARETFVRASDRGRERGDPDVVADAALGFAQTGDAAFVDVEGVNRLRAAADQLPADALKKRARVLAHAVQAVWTDPSYHALGGELAREALTAARASGHNGTLVTVLDGRLAVNGGPDLLAERLTSVEELSGLMDGLRPELELRARRWRLNAFLQTGRVQEGLDEVAAYVQCAEDTHLPRFLYNAALRQCFHPLLRGDFARATALVDAAREAGHRAGDAHATAAWTCGRGTIALYDPSADLGPFIDELGRQAERLVMLQLYPTLFGAVLLSRGEVDRARAVLEPIIAGGAGAISMNMLTLSAYAVLGQVAVHEGNAVLAHEVLEHQVRYADQVACTGAYLPMGAVATHAGRLAAYLGDPRADALTARGRALDSAMSARPWLDGSTLDPRVGAAPLPVPVAAPPSRTAGIRAVFRSSGDVLTLETDGRVHHLKRGRGWSYIETLVRDAGTLHAASDLAGVAIELRDEGAGPALDDQAKRMYRERVNELRAELAEAEDHHDIGRAERARTELEFLVAELSGAVGLGGRNRRTHSAVERARSSVTRAIRRMMKAIREVEPELGRQLNAAIHTGHDCRYEPSELLELRLEAST